MDEDKWGYLECMLKAYLTNITDGTDTIAKLMEEVMMSDRGVSDNMRRELKARSRDQRTDGRWCEQTEKERIGR